MWLTLKGLAMITIVNADFGLLEQLDHIQYNFEVSESFYEIAG
jgi:hypothetical protein